MTSAGTQRRAKSTLAEQRAVPSRVSPVLLLLKSFSQRNLNDAGSHGTAHGQLAETRPIWGLGHALCEGTLCKHLAAPRLRAADLSTNNIHKNVTFGFRRLIAHGQTISRAGWKAFVKAAFAAAHKLDSLESVSRAFFSAPIPKFRRHQHGSLAEKRRCPSIYVTTCSRDLDLGGFLSLQRTDASISPIADF